MKRYILSLLEIIFPTRAGAALVARTEALPGLIVHVADCTALSEFKDPAVRASIHELKYHNNPRAATLLGQLLREYAVTQTGPVVLVPIPLSPARQRSRGYNQVTVVAKQAVKNLSHVHLTTTLLKRTRDTAPQTSLNRAERLTNLTDAFAAAPRELDKLSPDATVVIVDDVLTTGATMNAAKAAIALHTSLPIRCLSLAH